MGGVAVRSEKTDARVQMSDAGYQRTAGGGKRGFALIITVVLVGFLALMLMSLAMLTRTEMRVAGEASRLEEAKANALIGLNVAIGQLQRYAGPDTRVTTRGEVVLPNATATKFWTGVWDSNSTAGNATGNNVMAWLVSGSEGGARDGGNVSLVSARQRSGEMETEPAVEVPKMRIGEAGNVRGRYAYWVGDQGVKVPVGDVFLTNAVLSGNALNYAPYDVAEVRERLVQQLGVDKRPDGFEPRDIEEKLREVAGIGLEELFTIKKGTDVSLAQMIVSRDDFHHYSTGSYAVLANSNEGGLRVDLSRNATVLGKAVEDFLDYEEYTEKPEGGPGINMKGTFLVPNTYQPNPLIGWESMRRRHIISAPTEDKGFVHTVHPVLAMFYLWFGARGEGGSGTKAKSVEIKAECMVMLWNPYTSALVPEDLTLEVTGLPIIKVRDLKVSLGQVTGISSEEEVVLQKEYGRGSQEKLTIKLGTEPLNTVIQGEPDVVSWLPGRVYYWKSSTPAGGVGSVTTDGWPMEFHNRDSVSQAARNGVNYQWVLEKKIPSDSTTIEVSGPETIIEITLKKGDDILATYVSPKFEAFNTHHIQAKGTWHQFAFPIRLCEDIDSVELKSEEPSSWLVSNKEPKENPLLDLSENDLIVPFDSSLSPTYYDMDQLVVSNYENDQKPKTYNRLLDRDMRVSKTGRGRSYNEDVPLFELPRQPLLSLGEMQHLHVKDKGPFVFGNSRGKNLNIAFDRYFFSGLSGSNMTALAIGDLRERNLPNTGLKILSQKADGEETDATDILRTDGLGAQHMLQGGAYNINSLDESAWRAVLRTIRFDEKHPFKYANVMGDDRNGELNSAVGTVLDDQTVLTAPGNITFESNGAAFLRFSQSAQETFKAEKDRAAEKPLISKAKTHLFRQGMRILSADEVNILAEKIVERIKERIEEKGLFRSLEDFLDVWKNKESVLELAVRDAGLNKDGTKEIDFSSQYLTQADIMTALAPVLFTRSDTFVVRAYGEAMNGADVQGRTWCEAVVQRMPEPVRPANATGVATDAEYSQPPTNFGRKFKIISFRWLNESDL